MQIKDLRPGDIIYLWSQSRWMEATVTYVSPSNLSPYLWVHHTKGKDLLRSDMPINQNSAVNMESVC